MSPGEVTSAEPSLSCRSPSAPDPPSAPLLQVLQDQISALQAQLASLSQLGQAPVPLPDAIKLSRGALLPGQAPAAAAGQGGRGDAKAGPGLAAGAANNNHLEVLLHTLTLAPEQAGLARYELWPMLVSELLGTRGQMTRQMTTRSNWPGRPGK